MTREAFYLNEVDRASFTWTRIADHLKSELDRYREQNDATLDVEQTALIRGRIAELKKILALGSPKPQVSKQESDSF